MASQSPRIEGGSVNVATNASIASKFADRRDPHSNLPGLSAAFTLDSASGESQELVEYLEPRVLESKALFYLRRDNFGFAGPQGSIAIVKSEPSLACDRSLVIARVGNKIFARRVLRGQQPGLLSLAGETPDPRRSPRTQLFRENEVALHEVVGILFRDGVSMGHGTDEAVPIEDSSLLSRIEIAYRVKEESAIPLVLPKQIALGGRSISFDQFDEHQGEPVALMLDDGSNIFKRVGASLPGDLRHLREICATCANLKVSEGWGHRVRWQWAKRMVD